jgi:hypothetical protein
MGIKKLKKENEILNLNLANMLERFDTTKTKKYSQFLVKMLNQKIESWQAEQDVFRPTIQSERIHISPVEKTVPNNSYENMLSRVFLCDYIFSWNRMERFVEFTELMERGLIDEKDISKYDSWDMLEKNLFEAKNRELFKKAKKEIHKIFEDDNYLIFRPLTYAASCSYGYQTKWCTAMVNDPGYFYNHSRGILIYLIDKKENKKFAFYKHFLHRYEMSDDHEDYAFKTFNQEDKQIDTIQTGLPINILQIILMECDLKSPTTIPNYKLFSEEEKNEMRRYNGPLPEDENLGGEEMVKVAEEIRPIVPITRRLRRRPSNVVTMANTPVLEPHGEDVMESEIEEECVMEEKCVEDLKLRVDICIEKLEKQIVEHLIQQDNNDRQG